MVYLVLVLLIAFLLMRDSEKKVNREIALICLACAAGLKIYPALFGVLYIKEKRFKEAVRAIIYGVLIFFLPYIFFGGIDGLKQNICNLIEVNKMVWEEGCFNSLVHITVMFGHKTGMATETAVQIGKVISNVYFAVLLLAALFLYAIIIERKFRWVPILLLCFVLITQTVTRWHYIYPQGQTFFQELSENGKTDKSFFHVFKDPDKNSLKDEFIKEDNTTGQEVVNGATSAGARTKLLVHAWHCFWDSKTLGVGLGNSEILARDNEVIENAYEELAPHKICAYIYELSNAFNRFYHETKILSEEDETKKKSYIALLNLTKEVLEECIDILGFKAPERM